VFKYLRIQGDLEKNQSHQKFLVFERCDFLKWRWPNV